VQDEAFLQHPFFDRRDRVQVKYEMLRRHRVEHHPVSEVADSFGVSRQSFYAAEAAFEAAGLPGLLPRPPGPRHAHKCTDQILDFAVVWRGDHPREPASRLAEAVKDRFGITIHPRSILRALARRKKGGSSQRRGA
jgi:transposase